MAKKSPKSSPPARKKRNWLLGGLLGLFALGGGWLWYDHRKFNQAMRNDPFPDPPGPGYSLPVSVPAPPNPTKPTYRPDSSFPLSIYMKGQRIRFIQMALNHRHKAGLEVDGFWGPKTEEALKRFKYPTAISEASFNKLVAAYSPGSLGAVPTGRKAYAPGRTWLVDEHGESYPAAKGEFLGTVFAAARGWIALRSPAGTVLFARENQLGLV